MSYKHCSVSTRALGGAHGYPIMIPRWEGEPFARLAATPIENTQKYSLKERTRPTIQATCLEDNGEFHRERPSFQRPPRNLWVSRVERPAWSPWGSHGGIAQWTCRRLQLAKWWWLGSDTTWSLPWTSWYSASSWSTGEGWWRIPQSHKVCRLPGARLNLGGKPPLNPRWLKSNKTPKRLGWIIGPNWGNSFGT